MVCVCVQGLDYLVLNHITGSRFGLWLTAHNDSAEGQNFVDEMFQVNTMSYMWLATAAIGPLSARPSAGQIVVVSSLAGHVGTPKTAVYSATKHALHGFFDALRIELRMLQIRVGVTLCAIGATDTEGARDIKTQISSVTWDPPAEAALAIIKGAATKAREIFHPHHIVFPSVLFNTLMPPVIDYALQVSIDN